MLIKRGHTGASVRRIQRLLNSHGFRVLVDGVFGPQTEAAVRAFQRRERLLTDGVVGPVTMAALERCQRDSRRGFQRYCPVLEVLAEELGVDPCIIAAIAWQESRWGAALDHDYRGDRGHGRGIMQIDDRAWRPLFHPGYPKWWYSHAWGLATGALIYKQAREILFRSFPFKDSDSLDWAAVAAYNCGPGNVAYPESPFHENPEWFLLTVSRHTTGGNYALKVWKKWKELKSSQDSAKSSSESSGKKFGRILRRLRGVTGWLKSS